MRLRSAAGITDPGRRRLRNEDAYICEPPLFAVADAAGLGGAAGGVGTRVEIEDDRLAAQVGERDRLAVLVGQGEVGRLVACLKHPGAP